MGAPEKPISNNDTFGGRVRAWRAFLRLSVTELAEQSPLLTASYISRVEHDLIKNVSRKYKRAIAEVLGITSQDLEHYPPASKSAAQVSSQPASSHQAPQWNEVDPLRAIGEMRAALKAMVERLDSIEALLPQKDYEKLFAWLQLRIQGQIAAGQPLEIYKDSEMPSLNLSGVLSDDTYALEVAGRSMIDVHIIDGDYIFVERNSSAEQGALVVAVNITGTDDPGRATLKRFYRYADRVELHPANADETYPENDEKYKPFIIAAEEWGHSWQIQGTVKGLYRPYSSTGKPKKS